VAPIEYIKKQKLVHDLFWVFPFTIQILWVQKITCGRSLLVRHPPKNVLHSRHRVGILLIPITPRSQNTRIF